MMMTIYFTQLIFIELEELVKLQFAVVLMKHQLKSDHYQKMAESINLASEQRKVEQEFKLLDNFNLGGREKEDPYSHHVTPIQFGAHFEEHFSSKVTETPYEVEHFSEL